MYNITHSRGEGRGRKREGEQVIAYNINEEKDKLWQKRNGRREGEKKIGKREEMERRGEMGRRKNLEEMKRKERGYRKKREDEKEREEIGRRVEKGRMG